MTVFGKCRFSYCNVFEARETPSGDKKFSVSVLIPKEDEQLVAKVKKEIENAKSTGIEKGTFTKAQVAASTFKLPLRDGDAEVEGGARGPEYKGMFFFNAASKNRPGVVGRDARTELMDADEFYSGVWGNIDVNFYPFAAKGPSGAVVSRGVAAGLNNLMKTDEDARLDGRQRAEDAFGGMEEGEEATETADAGPDTPDDDIPFS